MALAMMILENDRNNALPLPVAPLLHNAPMQNDNRFFHFPINEDPRVPAFWQRRQVTVGQVSWMVSIVVRVAVTIYFMRALGWIEIPSSPLLAATKFISSVLVNAFMTNLLLPRQQN